MVAPNRNRHPANADRQGIASEGTKVQRFHRNTLVEPEVLETADLALVEQMPLHRRDPTATADRELVEGKLKLAEGRRNRHCD